MATCKKCGADMDENAKQCPVCGAPVEQDQGNSNSKQNAAEAAFTEFNNTADTTAEFDSKDITDNKVMAVLAYIGILFLIPLLAAPNSRFARFHANQGLVLFLAEVVLGAAGGVLGLIPFVGWIISSTIAIVCLAFMIIGIVNAANGKAKELQFKRGGSDRSRPF